MIREFPLWACVLLPWCTALLPLVFARPLMALLGPRRAALLSQYLSLGASALVALFCVQGIDALLAPEDPRALGQSPWPELFPPVTVGELRLELALVGDRLSVSTALLIAAAMVLARFFMGGQAGLRDLGLDEAFGLRAWLQQDGPPPPALVALEADPAVRDATLGALRRLGLLGLLEGAAMLVVLAGDLGLALIGWAALGVGSAAAVARRLGDERRASAATRVLALGVAGDLGLGAAGIALVLAGIGLAHTGLWAPLVGDQLYAIGLLGLPNADLIASLLLAAVFLRMLSLAPAGNSLAEAALEAALIPVPAIYLLLRFQRVLAYSPSLLAYTLIFGMLLAAGGAAVALLRPRVALGRRRARPGIEQGLAGTAAAWTGLFAMGVGVGAWRGAALLLLAFTLSRLGLRAALVIAGPSSLAPWTARVGRLSCWMVAGVAPALSFAAIAQLLVDVLTRKSLLAPQVGWLAAAIVLLVCFAHAAAIARIWYEALRPDERRPVQEPSEDGLDFGPLALCALAMLTLGVVSFAAWFGLLESPLAWLDRVLPLAGGHELAPLGPRQSFRSGLEISRPWKAGGAALVALVTGFAWTWARERFRGVAREEPQLVTARRAAEFVLAGPRKLLRAALLVLAGLSELAAQGVGHGLFESIPQIAARVLGDLSAAASLRLRRFDGAERAVVGLLLGVAVVLGWVYARPDAASLLPADDYSFGGLRPKLIRAGGSKSDSEETASPDATAPGADVGAPPAVNPAVGDAVLGDQPSREPARIEEVPR
ncbi:hypothetical protein G6O69_23335 [Pseudenhygromyxa sp. WMMC2535]|uniref:hypothetical protein n=1 Tax=Pseudenhygromyxa sp. WMMC2535 TaxID=2712867 RepID=UPI001555469A|nr:hypothetical protein [Pseudenhygromyxa sp. WMMC2535]NVB40793.1 hypothetical protein [Pseudenhygromyxa sp. WMMC2535]